MSLRTAEANKAIVVAWEQEQKLVTKGTGTRDWSPQQQIDIIEKGKAYDDDGRAIEGHHMKNVASFPELQGNPENIQFLSRTEHFEAHGGSYQNPTNGYYNPITKDTTVFVGDELRPCQIIKLSNPIIALDEYSSIKDEVPKSYKEANQVADGALPKKLSHQSKALLNTSNKPKEENIILSGFHKVRNSFRNFESNHPIASEIIKTVGPLVAEYAIAYGTSAVVNGLSSKQKITTGKNVVKTATKSNNTIETVANIVSDEIEKATRSSPKAHTVSGYTAYRYGKKIEVAAYPRGGKTKT